MELQNGKAFVTPITAGPITGNSITRAAQVVDSGGTIHIKPGTYTRKRRYEQQRGHALAGQQPRPGDDQRQPHAGRQRRAATSRSTALNPATQYDNFIVNGTVTLGGADLNVISTLVSPTGPFTIISNDSNDAVNGQFAQGSNVTVNSVPFNINYAGGDGNDVVLTIAAADPVYVNDNWVITTDIGPAGFSLGDQVSNTGAGDDGTVTNRTYGVDAFDTVQGGVNGVAAGGEVRVLAGTYIEDVAITVAGTSVVGFGAGTKTVSGAIGGDGATFAIRASNVEIAGFTITREGNNTDRLEQPGPQHRRRRDPGPGDHQRADPRQRDHRQPHRHRHQQQRRPHRSTTTRSTTTAPA